MKKNAFLLLAVVIALGFVSCQTSGTAESKTTAEAPATDPGAAPAPTAAPTAPAKPDFQANAEAMPKTTIEFVSEVYDYGKVPAGTKVTHQFRFKNTGAEPLTLTRVKASCGCTTPSYSKDPVAAGEEGYIDVAFNSAGKSGVQNKSVTLTGNFEGSINKVLRIQGEVLPAENAQ